MPTTTKKPAFKIGDSVKIITPRDYTEEGHVKRLACAGRTGKIIRESNSHGACYEVQTAEGSAFYDPDEIKREPAGKVSQKVRRPAIAKIAVALITIFSFAAAQADDTVQFEVKLACDKRAATVTTQIGQTIEAQKTVEQAVPVSSKTGKKEQVNFTTTGTKAALTLKSKTKEEARLVGKISESTVLSYKEVDGHAVPVVSCRSYEIGQPIALGETVKLPCGVSVRVSKGEAPGYFPEAESLMQTAMEPAAET